MFIGFCRVLRSPAGDLRFVVVLRPGFGIQESLFNCYSMEAVSKVQILVLRARFELQHPAEPNVAVLHSNRGLGSFLV